jgi:hypothetical protein
MTRPKEANVSDNKDATLTRNDLEAAWLTFTPVRHSNRRSPILRQRKNHCDHGHEDQQLDPGIGPIEHRAARSQADRRRYSRPNVPGTRAHVGRNGFALIKTKLSRNFA